MLNTNLSFSLLKFWLLAGRWNMGKITSKLIKETQKDKMKFVKLNITGPLLPLALLMISS